MVRSIEFILRTPFSKRPIVQQLGIVIEGKPRPDMSSFFHERGLVFDTDCYDKEQWLTACEKRGGFYCWPCLLFIEKPGTLWNSDGFYDYENLYESINEHNFTADHIIGLTMHRNFICINLPQLTIRSSQKCEDDTNKDFLARLFKFMCREMFKTSLCPPNVKNFHEYILETCADALNIFGMYEMRNLKTDLAGINWIEIVPGILKSLSDTIKMVIKEEMRDCTHVSLIISEHSREDEEVLVSFVFRYLRGWEVSERFEGFYRVGENYLIDYVTNVLKKYEIENKILSFSYDGATTSLKILHQVLCTINTHRILYGAELVPCYFHSFETIVERSLSQMDVSCDNFFKTLSCMRSYIQSSPKMFNSFSSLVQGVTDLDLNGGCFKFIRVLTRHRSMFIEFFSAVMTNHDDWTGDDVVKAMEFHRALQNIRTVFLIEGFCILSDLVVSVSDILSSSSPERIFEKAQYEKCHVFLSSSRGKFPELWYTACSKIENLQPNASSSDQLKDMCTRLNDKYNTIIDHLIDVMKTRIEPLENLNFFFLLNLQNSRQCLLSDITKPLGALSCEVESEMREMGLKYPSCNEMTVHNLMKFLKINNLQGHFKTTHKLARIILSMPCKPASLDGMYAQEDEEMPEIREITTDQTNFASKMSKVGPSKLDVIHSFSRGFWPYFTIPNYWSIICIEKDIASTLPSHEQFHGYLSRLSTLHCIHRKSLHQSLISCFSAINFAK